MRRSKTPSTTVTIVLLLTVTVVGCGTAGAPRMPDLSRMFGTNSSVRDEEEHRQKYQSNRDPAELRWLLANRISSGMTVSEVARVIGEEGRRVHDDSWIKKGGGYYQSSDTAWKWEQDRNGQSLFLVFRDGKLVNFDPTAYEEPVDSFEF